jgi:hypothetical protein
MAINFPNSPSVGQLYEFNDKTWRWSGDYWEVFSAQTGYVVTAFNVGGGNEVFSGKSGNDLYFRTISGGTNTNVTTVGNLLKIDVTSTTEDLQNTLAAGNTTSGNNIIMTEGDDVIFKYAGFNNNINTQPITTNRNINFPDNDGVVALTSDIKPFTGNTSGSCITDLYVTNLYGCSPINIQNDTIIDGGLTVTTGLFSSSTDNVLRIVGSGATEPLFKVEGSSGELFSVTDSLEGSLFSVNDISGLPILDVNSDSTIQMGSITAPSLFTTVLTTATGGTENIYSLPTSTYTGGFFDYTLVGNGGARAGVITSIWSGTTTQYQDVSTNDIGSSTSGVTFDVSVSGNNAILSVSAVTGTYTIKTIVRTI